MDKLSRAQLSLLLDERNAQPLGADELDRRIWEQCGADRGILVLDLSGFTRITRKRGILHFLALYRRASRLFSQSVRTHAGRLVKGEADNIIASFPTAHAAFASAVEMVHAAAKDSGALEEDDQIRPCIAVGFGHILELADDFFGDEVNITFKLGEDIAQAGEVLITEAAYERLQLEQIDPLATGCEIEIGRVPVRYWAVRP